MYVDIIPERLCIWQKQHNIQYEYPSIWQNACQINRPSVFHNALVTHLYLLSHYCLHRILLTIEGAFSLRVESEELILKTKKSPLVVLSAAFEYDSPHGVVIQVSSVKIKSRCMLPEWVQLIMAINVIKLVLNFRASGTVKGMISKRNYEAKWTPTNNPNDQWILSVIRTR